MRTRGRSTVAAVATAALAVAMLAGCTQDEGSDTGPTGGTGGEPITVWTADTLPDRVAKTEAIIEKFTAATGVQVELVGVPEDQFNRSSPRRQQQATFPTSSAPSRWPRSARLPPMTWWTATRTRRSWRASAKAPSPSVPLS